MGVFYLKKYFLFNKIFFLTRRRKYLYFSSI